MKTLLFPALFAGLSLLACPLLPAAQQAANYAEAKTLVADDGYIIVAFADGWDNFSEARCKKLMANKEFLKAAGNAVLIPLPVADITDEVRKKQKEEICGELKAPNPFSYPALILFDKDGRHYATLWGGELTRGKTSKVAADLAACMASGKERYRLLSEAEQATGPKRASLLFKAYQIPGLFRAPKNLPELLAQADPQDESGARRAQSLNPYAFANSLGKKTMEEAMAEVEKIINDPVYSDIQKQRACAAAIGYLRRVAGVKGAKQLKHYAQLMQKFGPDTPEGRAAAYVLRNWIPSLRYAKGWTPAGVPTDETPVELEGKLPIGEAGTYTVHFQYTKGADRLVILAVELYDGKTKVAEDRHWGFTGAEQQDNTYTLEVPRAVREPHLFITTQMKTRNSYGNITIEKQ